MLAGSPSGVLVPAVAPSLLKARTPPVRTMLPVKLLVPLLNTMVPVPALVNTAALPVTWPLSVRPWTTFEFTNELAVTLKVGFRFSVVVPVNSRP